MTRFVFALVLVVALVAAFLMSASLERILGSAMSTTLIVALSVVSVTAIVMGVLFADRDGRE